MLSLEYLTGLHRQFPLVYVIPVSLAAWYSGQWPALALAVLVATAHVTFQAVDGTDEGMTAAVAMAAFRTIVIAVMVLWFARLAEHERALRREVQQLKGLLPICSFCKSIKNEAGEWERLEPYISRRSKTQFSHGVCPTCLGIQYGALTGDQAS